MHILSRDSRVSGKNPSAKLAFSSASTSASASASAPRSRSWTWSILCSIVILNSFLSILSPSTAGGKALAALTPGFCGDCQTFANAIAPCGGSFVPSDIEINGEYVLQQAHSKCSCTEVMQKVLWTCAKCEFLAGHQSKSPPPQKYQTQCMAWGMTIDEWKAPYTGQVAPGTQTELGNGGVNPPAPPPSTSTDGQGTKPTQPGNGNGGGGNGGNGNKSSSTDPNQPTSSSDNSVSGGNTSQTDSGPNTTAIVISVCIIGVAGIAGAVAVVMMKRRRRRHTPLDLDSSPALANFMAQGDQWDKPRPGSPPLPPAPVASAAPVVGGGRHHPQYDQFEGSVVGGYDPKYDQYDQYGHPGGHGAYDGYGQGQYGNQYSDHHYQGQYDQGYHHQQEAYPMHDYGYDHGASGAPHHGGSVVGGDSKYR